MNPRPRNSLPALRRVPLALTLLMASTDLLARQTHAHRLARQSQLQPPAQPGEVARSRQGAPTP